MKLAHISDTHLGYFAYSKTASGRLNQREVDVCETFGRCLDAILPRNPDLVVHSGDLFDKVRPSNYSLIFAYKTLAQFQTKRDGKPLVIVGGNHDTPLSTDSVNILRLFEDIPGVHVITDLARAIEVDGIHVLGVPHRSLEASERISWAPPPGSGPSVLVVHGLADLVAKRIKAQSFEFSIEETRAPEWSYVALGDWHVHQSYGPNICYAGSTDFTSNDIWGESSSPKGWVWFDSEVAQLEFVEVPTRKIIDLPPIDARDLDGVSLGESLRTAATWDPSDEPIVRQRILNVMPELRREWPIATIRELQQLALSYLPSQVTIAESRNPLASERKEGETLEWSWERHADRVPLPGGVDREDFKNVGLALLQEVIEHEAEPIEA